MAGQESIVSSAGRPSESVRKVNQGLQSLLSMRRIDARRTNANAIRVKFSKSFLLTHFPQPPDPGTYHEHSMWRGGDDGSEQGAIPKGSQRGGVRGALRH